MGLVLPNRDTMSTFTRWHFVAVALFLPCFVVGKNLAQRAVGHVVDVQMPREANAVSPAPVVNRPHVIRPEQLALQRAVVLAGARVHAGSVLAQAEKRGQMVAQVVAEARKEFFGEGFLWHDMKRLGKDIEVSAGNTLSGSDVSTYKIPYPIGEDETRDELISNK